MRPPFEDDWWEKGLDYFTDEYISTWGFKRSRRQYAKR